MTNSQINKSFLASITANMKEEILSNIANHYGISQAEAEEEVLDVDAESIMDYITGPKRAAISVIYQGFTRNLKA